jgi:hypothetical protein
MLLKKRQAQIILEIERVRSRFTPDRSKMTRGGCGKMPSHATEAMNKLFLDLRSLKSNKRAAHCRINEAQ